MENSYSQQEKEYLKKLGNRIREYRKNTHLSQEDLSIDSELDRSYIGSVERGERNIAIINLNKIAKALDIPISNLLDFE